MNIKILQQAWKDWLKTGAYTGVRFGQYLRNEYDFEVDNSFYEVDNGLVYQKAFHSLTISVSEIQ